LSVIIPAYREEAVIAAKLENIKANGYPGDVQVVVVADDSATAEAAKGNGAKVLEPEERLGKAEALNRGVAAASNDVLIVTDADARLTPGSLEALVRWFDDPAVGAVAGEKQVAGKGQRLYWRFESWLKRRESRLGKTLGLFGELAAVRRQSYRELPADTPVDDLWMGLDVLEAGDVVRYESAAVAEEDPAPSLREEWERRTRIQAGQLDLFWRRRRLLVPGESPIAGELWGHKLVRSFFGPLAHFALLVLALRSMRRSRLGAAFVAGHAVGVTAIARERMGAHPSTPARAAGLVIFLQATALGGVVRYARGDRPAIWPKPERPPSSTLARP
jgi:cellulose synthase/poly-beta-1,6-N-acetylglucosamine synthase-like glycosyltransferase